ncbi:hypothetical protein Tco_1019595 [Tanacetum coccineum]|uniref:Uncharacterized protein n=1 Tax=Tanacetum coccineum TaxID=301880 RepID=A0ABQ5FZ22_9ASTR
MIEPEDPLKRKDQIALDEQIARDIQAKLDVELIDEQKVARKQEEEANMALIESCKNTQDIDGAVRRWADRLPIKEREELTDEYEGKEKQKIKKKNNSKGKSFDEIQKLFDKEMKRVNTFVAMGFEGKRARKEQQQESLKKQRMEEDKESDEVDLVSEDDEGELMKHLVIKKDEDIAIDAIPLATKLPVIIDYKLHKEGMLVHYQMIRADRSSMRYSSMIRMLQGIVREDLEALWKIVKTKYGDIRPGDEFERVLWGDLKVMFEPDKRSDVWRMLQGYRVMFRVD